MLWPALCDPDPVLIFEHAIALQHGGRTRRRRRARSTSSTPRFVGTDATSRSSPTAGRCARRSSAADELAGEGIEAEVIDLRVPAPARHADHRSPRWRAPTGRWSSTRGGAVGSLVRRDQRADHRGGLLRPRCAGRPGVQRRGPDALRQAPRGRGAPAGGRRRGRGAPDGVAEWASSPCPRLVPTWKPARSRDGSSSPATRCSAATSWPWSRPRSPRSRSRSSRTGRSTNSSCPKEGGYRWERCSRASRRTGPRKRERAGRARRADRHRRGPRVLAKAAVPRASASRRRCRAHARPGVLVESPLVRHLAERLGVDIQSLSGLDWAAASRARTSSTRRVREQRPRRSADLADDPLRRPSLADWPVNSASSSQGYRAPAPVAPSSKGMCGGPPPREPRSTRSRRPPSKTASARCGGDRRAHGALEARGPHYYLSATIDLCVAAAWLEEANLGRPVSERLVLATCSSMPRRGPSSGFPR